MMYIAIIIIHCIQRSVCVYVCVCMRAHAWERKSVYVCVESFFTIMYYYFE